MKKQNLLKVTLVAVAMFVFSGAMAQPASINTNYVIADEVVYQTAGLGLTLIALPDLSYHPDYVAADNSGRNTISQWRWVYGGDWAAGTEVQNWSASNLVALTSANLPTAPATDVLTTRVFRVKERFNIAGACESSTDQTKTVAVVAEPVITTVVGTNASTDWTEVTAGTAYSYCGESITDELTITLTEFGSLASMRNYTYGISVSRVVYDGNMTAVTTSDVTTTFGQTANLASMITGLSHTFTTPSLTMVEDASVKMPTEYIFSITPTSLTSTTSRLSHFRAAVANSPYNNVPTTTISYTLYPTPTTGPIYHIPNTYAF